MDAIVNIIVENTTITFLTASCGNTSNSTAAITGNKIKNSTVFMLSNPLPSKIISLKNKKNIKKDSNPSEASPPFNKFTDNRKGQYNPFQL
jgi:threonine synthase